MATGSQDPEPLCYSTERRFAKKQTVVATSSGEAEIFALAKGCEIGVAIRSLLCEMIQLPKRPIELLTDATVAAAFAKSSEGARRTRSIDIRYHFVRDLVDNNEARITIVSTNDQRADILTKAPTAEQLHRQVDQLMKVG